MKLKKIRWNGYEVYMVCPTLFTKIKWKIDDYNVKKIKKRGL